VRVGIKITFENKRVSFIDQREICAFERIKNNLLLLRFSLNESKTFIIVENRIQDWHER
jgi:hypothetical protein